MPHKFELAPSARAKCRGCGLAILKGELRFGERLPNPFADGENVEMTHWFHVPCAAFRRPEAFLATVPDAIVEIDRKADWIREAELGVAHRRLPRVSTAERASSGRATCRACKELIPKDTWRISLVFYEEGRFVPSGFIHVNCVPAYCETTAIMPRVRHFSPALTESDAAELTAGFGAEMGCARVAAAALLICLVPVAGCWRRTVDTGPPPATIVSAGCPADGCQYGPWTATRNTDLFAEPGGFQLDLDLGPGDVVLAQSGEIHSTPRRARVVTAGDGDRAQGIRSGDAIYTLYPLGDGGMALWQNGFMKVGSSELVVGYDPPLKKDQSPLVWTWWVKVRLVDGTIAWLKNPRNFQGMDKVSRQ